MQLKEDDATIVHPELPRGFTIKKGSYSTQQLKRMIQDEIHKETRQPRRCQIGIRSTLEIGLDEASEVIKKIPLFQRKQKITMLGEKLLVNYDKLTITQSRYTSPMIELQKIHHIDPKMLLAYDMCIKCYCHSHLFYRNMVCFIQLETEQDFEDTKMEFTQHFNEAHPDLCKQKLEQKQNVRAFQKTGETKTYGTSMGGGDTYTSSIRSWITRNDSN